MALVLVSLVWHLGWDFVFFGLGFFGFFGVFVLDLLREFAIFGFGVFGFFGFLAFWVLLVFLVWGFLGSFTTGILGVGFLLFLIFRKWRGVGPSVTANTSTCKSFSSLVSLVCKEQMRMRKLN